jgi:hypothetical protein
MKKQRTWFGILFILAVSPARASAPLGRYTVGTSTVLDNRTNLTWQRAPVSGTPTATQAGAKCTSGWRLPTVSELQSIVDITTANPAIDGSVFQSTPTTSPTFFWSSTPLLGSPGNTWVVDFADGSTTHYDDTSAGRVRCVR